MLDYSDHQIQSSAETAQETESPETPLLEILERRQSVTPLRLAEPGPNPRELQRLLTVAMRVPHHGALEPWRIVLVKAPAREALSTRLAAAHAEASMQRDPEAGQLALRKIKAIFTVPVIVVVLSCVDSSARSPKWEQVLSAGAVCMNLISAAAGLGYSSTWLTGWTAYDPAARMLLGVGPDERIAGIIPIGTAMDPPQDRPRPSPQDFVTPWTAA
jgi:nitroreductase